MCKVYYVCAKCCTHQNIVVASGDKLDLANVQVHPKRQFSRPPQQKFDHHCLLDVVVGNNVIAYDTSHSTQAVSIKLLSI